MSQYPTRQKPKQYITFAAGRVLLNDQAEIKVISCNADPQKNGKNNNGQAYALFVVPIGADGSANTEGAIQVNSFAVSPTGVDKQQYPTAPDFRVFFGVE